MKHIKQFTVDDEIPSSAKYLSSIKTQEGYAFFYEVTIKQKTSSAGIDIELIVTNVINYLNSQTGKNFKPVGKNAQLIRDRVKTDTATLDDFPKCINNMVAEWDDNPKMKQYLRPVTLFSASKFDGYVNHKTTGQDAADAFSDLESYIS